MLALTLNTTENAFIQLNINLKTTIMKTHTLLFFALTFIMLACKKNDDTSNNGNSSATVISSSINIEVLSPKGADLLNPNTPNAFLEKDIKIFYLTNNGELKEVFNQFKIVSTKDNGSDKYHMIAFLKMDAKNTTNYIKWRDTDMDTINATFDIANNSTILSKIIYNDSLIFDNRQEKLIVLTK